MADWHDVMNARGDATAALDNARTYAAMIEDGRQPNPALASLLAAEAISLELRALGMLLDHVVGAAAAHVGPA